mmetsp:Transcript_3355/g.7336  ORF Transcript_3355/g.7336 Transcript_3355/m.7336 type:complete len:285 (-) Transcript_3355:383-1237(-)
MPLAAAAACWSFQVPAQALRPHAPVHHVDLGLKGGVSQQGHRGRGELQQLQHPAFGRSHPHLAPQLLRGPQERLLLADVVGRHEEQGAWLQSQSLPHGSHHGINGVLLRGELVTGQAIGGVQVQGVHFDPLQHLGLRHPVLPPAVPRVQDDLLPPGSGHLKQQHAGSGAVVGWQSCDCYSLHTDGLLVVEHPDVLSRHAHVSNQQVAGDAGAIDDPILESLSQTNCMIRVEVSQEVAPAPWVFECEPIYQKPASHPLDGLHLCGHVMCSTGEHAAASYLLSSHA